MPWRWRDDPAARQNVDASAVMVLVDLTLMGTLLTHLNLPHALGKFTLLEGVFGG